MFFLIYTLITIINTLIIITIVDVILMGGFKLKLHNKIRNPEFLIKQANSIDFQTGNECAGFSSAYLLRHMGIPAEGNQVYSRLGRKMKDGCVYPKEVCKILNNYGIKSSLIKGNIAVLKNEIAKGNPIIVFIRSQIEKSNLHFVPVVGYDEKFFYMADSVEAFANCKTETFNRKIEISEFKKLWNTSMLKMPFYKNLFISVK